MEVKEIKDVPRGLVLEFLESLDEELEHFRAFWFDESGKKVWKVLQPESVGLAALDKGKVVAVRYWSTNPNYPSNVGITGVVVKKKYWNQGINQMLHPLLVKLAHNHGIEKFLSYQDRENVMALWSAIKIGYRIVGVSLESKQYKLECELS